MDPDTTRKELADKLSATTVPSCKHMDQQEYRDGVAQMLDDLERLGKRDGCIAAAWSIEAITSLQRELAEARAEIESLKSRASLTPLTDESVRGVLIQCAPDEETTGLYGEFGLRGSFRLRPASEFGVPAEPAQKLVPLPEGARVLVPCRDGEQPHVAVVSQAPGMFAGYYRISDPALYGVPAERVRDLEAEVESLQEQLESADSAYRDEKSSGEGHRRHAQRLRKAIETADAHYKGGFSCGHVMHQLVAALTPPTATSGEKASTETVVIGDGISVNVPANIPEYMKRGELSVACPFPGNPPDDSGEWVYSQTQGRWVLREIHPCVSTSASGAPMPLDLIAAERKRQIESEGWNIANDDRQVNGQMALAAACYAAPINDIADKHWPWDAYWNKRDKHSRQRQLVIAGALIVAEIERLQRQDKRSTDALEERAGTIDGRIAAIENTKHVSDETMRMKFGQSPSAPAAESEGGEFVASLLSVIRDLRKRIGDDAARLSACEERCRELEAACRKAGGILEPAIRGYVVSNLAKAAFDTLQGVLATKAEGGTG